jgi:hypothetical protein
MNTKMLKIFIPVLTLAMIPLGIALFTPTSAADKSEPTKVSVPAGEVQKVSDDDSSLREENARLKEENAQLKKENQQLRRLLGEKTEPGSASSTQANGTVPAQTNVASSDEEVPLTHWLTISSGKRHNSRCRYFKTTEGRLCGPDEGTPCKLCGG